jgi:hypothetical protein
MCDYSLATVRNRLAVEGEELVVYRFPAGSVGLTSPEELESFKHKWPGWLSGFRAPASPCAVCIPPGARLVLRDIPERLRFQLGIGEVGQVIFIQREAGRHRDGLRFQNNQEILLQHLAVGQHATVLSLSADEATEEQAHEIGEHVLVAS